MARSFNNWRPAFLLLAGALIILGSFSTWSICPKDPCEGDAGLFHIYFRSGLDAGPGLVTAILGLAIVAAGLFAWRRHEQQAALVAGIAAAAELIVVTAYVVRVHVSPTYQVSGPAEGVVLAIIGGVIALVASIQIRRSAFVAGRGGIAGV